MGGISSTSSEKPDPVLPQPIVTFVRGTNNDYEFEKLIKHVTEILSTLATYVNLTPGIGITSKVGIVTYKESLKWIYALTSNQSKITSALIDEKIDKNNAKMAASEINAKIETIKNRIEAMNNEEIKIEERKLHAIPALHSCEEILRLFSDENYCLWNAVVISSQLLIAFVAIYADVNKRTLELLPSHKKNLNLELNKTVKTLEKYKEAVIKERIKAVQMKGEAGPYPTIPYYICGDGRWQRTAVKSTERNYSGLWTDQKPLPWDEFVDSEIVDRWAQWNVHFKRDAFNEYKSYINKLREVYERKFNDVISKLNNLKAS